MQSIVVNASCDRQTVRVRLKGWLSDGYRLTMVAGNAMSYADLTNMESLVRALDAGARLHLANDKSQCNVTLNHQTPPDGSRLEFVYTIKSFTTTKRLTPVTAGNTSTRLQVG